jgi:hypothetical protein
VRLGGGNAATSLPLTLAHRLATKARDDGKVTTLERTLCAPAAAIASFLHTPYTIH